MKTKSTTLKRFCGYAAAVVLTCTLLSEGQGSAQVPTASILPNASFMQVTSPSPSAKAKVLVALLNGSAIDGVVPSGKAEFTAFQSGTSLAIGAFNLNLPDGTVLAVALDGKVIGSMAVARGNANLLPLSSTPQVHPGEAITISLASLGGGIIPLTPTVGSVILSGTFQAP